MKFFLFIALVVFCFSQTTKVTFQLKEGNVTLEVHREWAPIGVDRFLTLVKEGYYNENGFFRVVPNFVVQFGISGNPDTSRKWRNARIQDDPVKKSNLRGFVSYAMTSEKNSRTTQLFINLINNQRLDGLGFAPFAFIDSEGMKIIDKIYSGYGQRPSQDMIYTQGNNYLKQNFPNMSYLIKASLSQ